MPTGGMSRSPNSPAAIAVTAGSLGLICGALTVGVMLGPSAIPSQVAKKPSIEITASVRSLRPEASAQDKIEPVSVSDCDQQTWPYITPQCLTEREETAQRKVRVITTDKIAPLVVSAIEQGGEDVSRNEDPVAQKDRPAREAANLSSGETMPAVTAKASPIGASTTPTRETKSMPVTAPPLIEQSPAPATDPQTAATGEPAPHAVAKEQPPNAESKNVREARHNRIREAKQRRAPFRDSDDDYDEPVYSPRSRVVERRTKREVFVPHETSERQQMIAIRRGGDQHPFGSVFGSLFR